MKHLVHLPYCAMNLVTTFIRFSSCAECRANTSDDAQRDTYEAGYHVYEQAIITKKPNRNTRNENKVSDQRNRRVLDLTHHSIVWPSLLEHQTLQPHPNTQTPNNPSLGTRTTELGRQDLKASPYPYPHPSRPYELELEKPAAQTKTKTKTKMYTNLAKLKQNEISQNKTM